MKTPKIVAYLKLIQLPNDLKIRNNIKVDGKTPRFDCIAFCGIYQPLDKVKTKLGQIYLYLMSNRSNRASTPKKYLQCPRSINFTGLFNYSDNTKGDQYCYGYPSNSRVLAKGKENPFYNVSDDGFIVIVSEDQRTIEIVIIENGKPFIDSYCRKFASGDYSDILNQLRMQAKPIYDYNNMYLDTKKW